VRHDYPFDTAELAGRVQALRDHLRSAEVPVELIVGGEVALPMSIDLADDELARVCLGAGSYLLVESPYTDAPETLEASLFALQVRGFRVLLAHPERSPAFLLHDGRLAELVDRGMRCSITAGSMAGRFGGKVQRFTADLFQEGLVHDVASDAHNARGRPPGLRHGFEVLAERLRGLPAQVNWFTVEAPNAILAGDELAPRHPVGGRRRLPLRSLRRGPRSAR
jgi:protein-tyrosine phosphatase